MDRTVVNHWSNTKPYALIGHSPWFWIWNKRRWSLRVNILIGIKTQKTYFDKNKLCTLFTIYKLITHKLEKFLQMCKFPSRFFPWSLRNFQKCITCYILHLNFRNRGGQFTPPPPSGISDISQDRGKYVHKHKVWKKTVNIKERTKR